MRPIAKIRTDFDDNFGIPRQPGIVPDLHGQIVFEPEFRDANAVRGLEEFSHIWLIWCFSENADAGWHPTVRPPKLGGNERRGVFATRAPYRPNPIGLSAVRLESIDFDSDLGPVLHVLGADLMNGTPIYDIKPYVTYTDSIPDAKCSFAVPGEARRLTIHYPEETAPAGAVEATGTALADGGKTSPAALAFAADVGLPPEKLPALEGVLAQDPRPGYQSDPERIYGIRFAGCDIRFKVSDNNLYVVNADI